MVSSLAPLSQDPLGAHRLGVRAAELRVGSGSETAGWIRAFEERLRAGAVEGRLFQVDGRPEGFVSWSTGNPLGIAVDLLYVEGAPVPAERYGELLTALGAVAGPPAFVPGPLAGVSSAEEERLPGSLGYRRFGRSEMILSAASTALLGREGDPAGLRPVTRADLPALAELHGHAYRGRFDRFLFLEDWDERTDAQRAVQDIVNGVWGELSPTGSWILEEQGRAVAAVLAVRPRTGVLVADVMVEPELQGRGLGRRVLSASLRALWISGERRIFLNVTEGNDRALRLYRALGFERSLGPTRDWYNAARIPIPPSG